MLGCYCSAVMGPSWLEFVTSIAFIAINAPRTRHWQSSPWFTRFTQLGACLASIVISVRSQQQPALSISYITHKRLLASLNQGMWISTRPIHRPHKTSLKRTDSRAAESREPEASWSNRHRPRSSGLAMTAERANAPVTYSECWTPCHPITPGERIGTGAPKPCLATPSICPVDLAGF